MTTDQPIERNEVFELAFRFITETNENIFLTGKAGSGKTTFLKYLKANSTKNIIVAAPTGVAAINAGGVTLHSLFQLPFHPFLPTANHKAALLSTIRINKQRQELLRKMELLVIDEISMVRADVMDAIDTILRSVRRNHAAPFGGVQLLCIGDLFQLPPVAQQQEWGVLSEYYASPFFFDSMVIKEQLPLLIELNKIYRQKDEDFVTLLNKVRNNILTSGDLEELNRRYDPGFKPAADDKYITLTSHNNQADLINRFQLQKILAAETCYEALVADDFPVQQFPAEARLVLKPGAQVMFLKNDLLKRYFNGKIGTVLRLEKEKVIVDCDGTIIEVLPETWENTRYTLNHRDGKLEQQTLGTFTQFPLRLAWAITIHKSQGLTFDHVMIDAGAAFSSGQVYVALSRCTRLDGIVFLSRIPPTAIYSNEQVIQGQRSLSFRGSFAERFAGARQAFTQQLLEDIFLFTDIAAAMEQLQFHVIKAQDKLNKGAVEWVENLVRQFIADKEVGARFNGQVAALMRSEGIIENNGILQKRISDAAYHFLPRLEALQQELKEHPLLTEHKETASTIDEHLQQLFLAMHRSLYYLSYCKNQFSVSGYLQHKFRFSKPRVSISAYAKGKKLTVTDIPNPELYSTLKRWRDMACEEGNLPIYLVANQASLAEICTYLPLNKKDLQLINGFGRAKAEKYGDEIIGAVESYCDRYGLETNIRAKLDTKPEKEKRERRVKKESIVTKPDSKTFSYNLFRQGKTVEEIAKERNLVVNTIMDHLAYFVGTGEMEVGELVSIQKQESIKAAAAIHGVGSVSTLFNHLKATVSYTEIRVVLAAMNNTVA